MAKPSRRSKPTAKGQAMSMSATSQPARQFAANPPTTNQVWVDSMFVTVRKDVPVATISFHTFLPESGVLWEVARLCTSIDHLRKMAEALTRNVEAHDEFAKTGKMPDATRD